MERKEFLELIGKSAGAVVIASCFGACSKFGVQPSFTPQKITVDFTINLSDPINASLKNKGGYIYQNGAIIAQTMSGTFIAVAQACTHQGSDVVYQSAGNDFFCYNHGSKFGSDGSVIQGPAASALQKLNTILNGTSLRIFS